MGSAPSLRDWSVNQELLLRNEYLAAVNRILRTKLSARLRLSDPERITLAEIGKRLCVVLPSPREQRVHIAGITRHPDSAWMEQIARSATQETGGYLLPCRYVLHDRDTKFCASFRPALSSGSVKTIQLPAKSPNLNAFAERWVRSVKQECLSTLILFDEGPLLRVLTEHSRHYHPERNHQGKGNRLLFPDVRQQGRLPNRNIICHQRLGGLLKYYQRAA